jgi:hypothetical protein
MPELVIPDVKFKKGHIPWNKGKNWSDEIKRKIGLSHKGKSSGMKGKIGVFKRTEVVRKKMSEVHKKLGTRPPSNLGKHHSEKTKIILSEKKKGEKNPNWKGGITLLVLQIRKSFKYRQWRSDVFTRDNFTCQDCGNDKGGNLEAHHCLKSFSDILEEYKIKTIEDALNCEELWNINGGTTLCEGCHRETDNFGWKIFNNKKYGISSS